MKKELCAIAWTSLLALNNVHAAITPDNNKVNPNIELWETADVVIQRWIVTLMTFLALAAIIYWLWWGFNILTAWGDEEKVSKWKTIIINAGIWLVVIFLAGSIVRWIITILMT